MLDTDTNPLHWWDKVKDATTITRQYIWTREIPNGNNAQSHSLLVNVHCGTGSSNCDPMESVRNSTPTSLALNVSNPKKPDKRQNINITAT